MSPIIIRPVMWTYLVATAIASLAVAATEPQPNEFLAIVVMAFLFGQLWLVAIWAAVGRAPRLIRAMGLMLGMIVGAAIVCHLDGHRSMDHLRTGLGPMLLVVSPAFVAALLTKLTLDWKRVGSTEQMRFPLKEILIWTTVVAVGSWLMSKADFSLIKQAAPTFALLLAAGLAAGVAGAICHRDAIPVAFKVAAVIFAFLAAVGCLKIGAIVVSGDHISWGAVVGGLYLAMAFLLRSYDDRNLSRRVEAYRRKQPSFALSEHD